MDLSPRMSDKNANVAPRKEAHVLEGRGAREEEGHVGVEVLVVQDFMDAHVDGFFEDVGTEDLAARGLRTRAKVSLREREAKDG